MSVIDDHLDQAGRNRDLAEELLAHPSRNVTHVQWAVIAAFYCAVHCMQVHLLGLGFDPANHVARGRLIVQPSSGIPIDVQDAYFWLKSRSESARYRLGRFSPGFVRTSVLNGRLKLITDFVRL